MIDISKDSEIKSKLQETSKDEKNGLLDSAIAGSSSMSSSSSSIGKKFDLSKWKYSQLRDALNSNDTALKFNQSDPCSIWYAHFNGPYICRQMEVHPDAKPVLLITGRDDLKMCDLSLDAAGLMKRKGAEITEKEFDNLWQHYGGQLKQWTP
ncbi:hypothetical protein WR25_03509 [Diploscapter pachys]|uniref:Myosin VI cargo binding domain-containing protein n=1 Tax=Diploscapter pachys TaxID=2018661 RepID=A0A2A2JCA0_9BILA|nr:hypothetical protein WR25_03509 [Diploscapter pachys]